MKNRVGAEAAAPGVEGGGGSLRNEAGGRGLNNAKWPMGTQ